MKFVTLCSPVLVLAALSSNTILAQEAASEADKTFAAKVSQSCLYEIEAGKLAMQMADGEDIKDLAWKEVQDHERINRELNTLSAAKNIPIPSKLSPELQRKLDRLKGSSGRDFDNAYLSDMLATHTAEEKLLAQQAIGSTPGSYKTFAAKTDTLIKQHIATLQPGDSKN